MGLLDSFDYDALLKKLLEGQAQPDSKAPFYQGLMGMGAQMLANSHRGFGNALGAGGLGYLEASNAERARQQRDPMQQINMANAVMGLREKAENAKAMADWQRGLPGRASPMAPQSDFAPGEAQGSVTPPMQVPAMPQGAAMGIPSREVVENAMNKSPSAAVRAWAKDIWDTHYKPFKLSIGEQQYTYGQDGKPRVEVANVDPTKPQMRPDGTAAFVPGAAEEQARLERLKQEGIEGVKAANTIMQVPDGSGGKVNVTQAQELARLQGAPQATQGDTAPPKDILAAMDELKRKGVATRWTPQTGLVMGEAALQPPPQYGRERSPAESASDMIPVEANKAAAVARATVPIETDAAYDRGLQTQNLKLREVVINEAKNARTQREMTNRMMQMNNDPNVASGALAEKISGLKNVAASFGVEIGGLAAEQTMQSIAAQMALTIRNPDSGMGMPGAVSDRDLTFLKSIPPGTERSKEGRVLIAESFNALNDRKIEVQRMMLKHEADGGKFDSAFLKKMSDYADKNPIFTEQKQKQVEKLSAAPEQPKAAPKVGTVRKGHVFSGGDPNDKRNWKKIGAQ